LNVTVPVGVPATPGETVAVNVSLVPYVMLVLVAPSVVVDPACVTVSGETELADPV
jgi:hypothetical protein